MEKFWIIICFYVFSVSFKVVHSLSEHCLSHLCLRSFCKVFKVICQQAAQRDPELTLAARWLGDHYGIVEWAEHLGCFGNLWWLINRAWQSIPDG